MTVEDYLGQARADPIATPPPELGRVSRVSRSRATLGEERSAHRATPTRTFRSAPPTDSGVLHRHRRRPRPRKPRRRAPRLRRASARARARTRPQGRRPHRRHVPLRGRRSCPLPSRLFARIAGFGGGRERGLRLVEEAARYPSEVQPNALFTLILLYNREGRYDDALRGRSRAAARVSAQPAAVARSRQHRAAREAAGRGTPVRSKQGSRSWHATRGRRRSAKRRAGGTPRRRARRAEGIAAARRELAGALAGATRDWLRGRIHRSSESSPIWPAIGRARSTSIAQAIRLCRQTTTTCCVKEARTLTR